MLQREPESQKWIGPERESRRERDPHAWSLCFFWCLVRVSCPGIRLRYIYWVEDAYSFLPRTTTTRLRRWNEMIILWHNIAVSSLNLKVLSDVLYFVFDISLCLVVHLLLLSSFQPFLISSGSCISQFQFSLPEPHSRGAPACLQAP